MRRVLFVFLFCCLCAPPALATAKSPLQVFVSVPPQRYLVERIGGEHVRVDVMLSPGEAPETFDPSLRQLKKLAASDLYFMIGVPFEATWINKLRSVAPGVRYIPCCDDLLSGSERGLDPHIWTSPRKAVALSRLIFEALAEEDPALRAVYAANHKRLEADLAGLDAHAREAFSGRRKDRFITAHAAWGHLARDYGLRELAVERGGREIGPRGLTELLTIARREAIRTVFVQPQQGRAMATTLAGHLQAEVIELDPLAEDYIANMTLVIDRIAGAVQ